MARSLIILLFLFGMTQCAEKAVFPILLPSGLEFSIEQDPSKEGEVQVQGTALNANWYTFVFTDQTGTQVVKNNDGQASYTYTEEGTYTIKFRAHTTDDNYAELTDTVAISFARKKDKNGIPTGGYITPLNYDDYQLVWNDEFDGNSLNEQYWNYEIGTGSNGWGNNELQYYRKENSSVDNGYLTIEAKREAFGGRNYTSSRMTTQGKKFFKYGRVDIRAALPYGKGIWPALWMLGTSFPTEGWPACGEIDIMEMVGGKGGDFADNKVHGTMHWQHNGGLASYGGQNVLKDGFFHEEFHVFSIIWDENQIKWLRDDIQYHVADIKNADQSELRSEYYFLFNVAVGGNWPGSPNGETVFPQKMHIDYIRVFQK